MKQEPLQKAADTAKAAWDDAKGKVTAAQAAVDEYADANSTAATANNRVRRSVIRQDYRALSGNTASTVPSDAALDTALENAKNDAAEKEKAYKDADTKKEDFLSENYVTYEDFMHLGMEAVEPVIRDYKRLFISSSGDYAAFVKGCMGARALYYFAAKDMTVTEIKDCLRDMFEAFDFDEFRSANNLLADCIDEIPKYLAKLHSTPETFWSEVEGAEEYDAKLERQKQQDPEKHGNRTWRDDRIEATRRAWEWWRCYRKNFTYLSLVARLVVLIPITSASVERVFSQVKFIIETIGESGLQETLELRLMERVNKYD